MRAMNGVADGEGERAAEDRRNDAHLDGVVDRIERKRIVEDAVEVIERVLAGVEYTREIAEEQEFAEGGDDQREARQYDNDEQICHSEREREPAPGSELEAAGTKGFTGNGRKAASRQDALLHIDQQSGHRHQYDGNGCGGVVERGRP